MKYELRKWRLSDAKELAAALNNKRILNNLRDGLPFPYTERDAAEYITAMRSADENDTFAYAITAEDHVIGSIGAFRQGNIHRQTAELGYYLAEEYWGQGIMSGAIRQLSATASFRPPTSCASTPSRSPTMLAPAGRWRRRASGMRAL